MKRTFFLAAVCLVLVALLGCTNNSLDKAYDQGGLGAGGTITADTGAVNIAGPDGLTVNGNVGIGTTSATEKLDVNGKVTASAYTDSTRIIFEAPSGTEQMRITDAGSVGIGTASPAGNLEVSGGGIETEVVLRVTDEAVGNALYLRFLTGTGSASGGNVLGGVRALITQVAPSALKSDLTFRVNEGDNDKEAMRITSGGNVGIGTTTPADKLEVSGGNIRVTGGSFISGGTTLNVPDYVFENDYPLMSLDELRTCIGQKKHLPNVPSVEDIKKAGLNISDFQMRLLEKIEELTLYTLEQEEKLDVQQQQLAGLQTRLTEQPMGTEAHSVQTRQLSLSLPIMGLIVGGSLLIAFVLGMGYRRFSAQER